MSVVMRVLRTVTNAERAHIVIAGLALTALGAVTLFQWRDATRGQQQDERVAQTRDVQLSLTQLLSQLQDIESSVRGFVVTGEPAFVESYSAARRAVSSQFGSLGTLTGDHPRRQAHYHVLEPLIAQSLRMAQTTVDLRRDSGFEAARQAVVTGGAGDAMDQIRVEIAQMYAEEQTERAQLLAAARNGRRDARALSAIATGSSFLLLAWVFALMLRETAERKKSEASVTRLNVTLQQHIAQLEEANKELESFSYSVSHHLRAPLRHVHGYLEMLQRATEGQLSDQAQRYVQVARAASMDLGHLIDDLLAYIRLGRTEMTQSSICLDEVVQAVIRELEIATPRRHIVWQTASLPPVLGDPALVKQVLINLIGNALKYSRLRDPARIEIGCAGEEDGHVILFVRDNGVGFDMQYAHKLFRVFERLHRAEEFEGTGVGLALVRRTVARHGGRVWAEGAVNHGAAFYFTLKRSVGVHVNPVAPGERDDFVAAHTARRG